MFARQRGGLWRGTAAQEHTAGLRCGGAGDGGGLGEELGAAGVGVVGALWGGNAAAGRRIARLAAFSAALYVFLYGTLAVAAMGVGGPPGDPGCTGICNIGDRLGNNTIFNLWCLPLWTAALGWAAAAYTARIRSLPATAVVPVPFTAARGVYEGGRDPMAAPETALPDMAVPEEAGRAARVRSGRRTARRVLLWVGVAVIAVLIVAGYFWAPSRG